MKRKGPPLAPENSASGVQDSLQIQRPREPLARRARVRSASSTADASRAVPGEVEVIDVENSPTQSPQPGREGCDQGTTVGLTGSVLEQHGSALALQAQELNNAVASDSWESLGLAGGVPGPAPSGLVGSHLAMGVGRGTAMVMAALVPSVFAVIPRPPDWPPPRLRLRPYPGRPTAGRPPPRGDLAPSGLRAPPDGGGSSSSSSDSKVVLHESEIARLEEQHADLWRQMLDEERAFCVNRRGQETELLRLQGLLAQVPGWRQQHRPEQQEQEQQRQPANIFAAAAAAAAAPVGSPAPLSASP